MRIDQVSYYQPGAALRIAALFSLVVWVLVWTSTGLSKVPPPAPKGDKADARLETYRDLIAKAQNFTLQRNRFQASRVLIRGIQRESRGTGAYKELMKALDELTSVFYTEKAQALFALAESMSDNKPREAIEQCQEALKLEDGNVSILKTMARTQIVSKDCAKADATVQAAEAVNSYSPEVRLLRLQVLDCQKNFEALSARLAAFDTDFEPVEKFAKGLVIKDLIHREEIKKAKALLTAWEAQMPDYPEVHFWKWRLAIATGGTDRAAALRYTQLCQNLTPRRRKSYILDVDLCKGKEAADAFLKENGLQPSSPNGDHFDE